VYPFNMERGQLGVNDVRALLFEAYIPFAEIERAIPWPNDPERMENDAEHSFSLALISGSIAAELGLDPNKAVALATVHDLVEVYAGDTSVWDAAGLLSKKDREADSLIRIKDTFQYHWLIDTIEEYEALGSEEACLVYALDKLLAVLMIMQGGGLFWKTNGITFDEHHQKYLEKRSQVARHPLVLEWYDNVHSELEAQKQVYFIN
jgi:5'-deoxynucleotidase YfbR-like HD superfamily hydrolase